MPGLFFSFITNINEKLPVLFRDKTDSMIFNFHRLSRHIPYNFGSYKRFLSDSEILNYIVHILVTAAGKVN